MASARSWVPLFSSLISLLVGCAPEAPREFGAERRAMGDTTPPCSVAHLAKDIVPGAGGSSPTVLGALGDVAVFIANDSPSGFEVWKSDGREAGTVLVKALYAYGPHHFTSPTQVGGAVYFVTSVDGAQGATDFALWRTDGTADGTLQIAPLVNGTFVALGTAVYFARADSASGVELWRSDGTAAGTSRVVDLAAGTSSGYPKELVVANGALYFSANDPDHGVELWKSDGTAAGTVLVKDIVSGATGGLPHGLAPAGAGVFFIANDGVHGDEPWYTDGTAAGTVLLADINPGTGSSQPLLLGSAGGRFLFSASSADTGREPWTSDGTAAGTALLADLSAGTASSDPRPLGVVGGRVVFTADGATTGREPWASDGTPAGTVSLGDVYPGATGSGPADGLVMGGKLFFTADDKAHGRELWRTDGTPGGTALLADLVPGVNGSWPTQLTQVGTRFAFSANDGRTGYEPWISDGTMVGTQRVQDIGVGAPSSSPHDFTLVGERVFFAADDGQLGAELWSYAFGGLNDCAPPVLTCPAKTVVEASGPQGAVVTYAAAQVFDDRTASPTLEYSQASGSTFPVGETTVQVTATDLAWNVSTCSFTVVVRDTGAPSITCPADMTLEATTPLGAVPNFAPAQASDAISTPTVEYTQSRQSWFALGDTTVTATAKDASGNTAQCTFHVLVQDTTPPRILCPESQSTYAANARGAEVLFSEATAYDAASTPTVTYSQARGSTFSLGETEVTATATDGAGLTASCTFKVTVKDPPAGCQAGPGGSALWLLAALLPLALARRGARR